jgi:hypothetical protein
VARVRLVVGALAAVVAAITLVVADVFYGDDVDLREPAS